MAHVSPSSDYENMCIYICPPVCVLYLCGENVQLNPQKFNEVIAGVTVRLFMYLSPTKLFQSIVIGCKTYGEFEDLG